MAGGKLTVRQKMINMMYLVLTALLALNVSAEILKAFHLVEVSMNKAGANIDSKNAAILKAIDKYVDNNKNDAKGKAAQASAAKVDKVAKDALAYLKALKDQLIQGAGGRKEGNPDEEIAEASNIEKHANLFMKQGKGAELKAKVNQWRVEMVNALPADRKVNVKSDLVAEDPKNSKQTWESEMFEHTPVAAVVTLLTKLENDVKNTEAQVLDELNKDLTAVDIVIDNFDAKVIPNNGTYIIQGSKFSADIFLAASSSRSQFDLTVNGAPIKVENGIGKYEVVGQGEGEKKYTGLISQKKLDGTTQTFKVEGSYTVVKPLAVVSATKMNVVYRAIPNPISISVPGYAANEIIATASVGRLSSAGQPGTYNIEVGPTDQSLETIVSVSVKDKATNTTKKMGEQRYRIKNIPRPQPLLGPIDASGDVTIGKLKASTFVATILKDFPFEGIKYTPQTWKLVYVPRVGNAQVFMGNGTVLTPQAQGVLRNARPGDKVILYDIKAVGPQGLVPLTSGLVLNVQ